MDERDFELLKALGKTKNITHAADLLYATQSSLSKRISAIEQELGITLILRSRQGIHFTPEGEEVLKRTAKAADQLTLMRETIDKNKGMVYGTLNAGVSINFAMFRLSEVLAQYQKAYPNVNTHIITAQSINVYHQLMNGNVDIAVLRGEHSWTGTKILLERERICAIYNQKYKDMPFSKIPYIERKTDIDFERGASRWMREHNFQPEQSGIYVDNIIACVEMVKRGLGWSIIPEICLKNFDGCIEPLYFKNGKPFERLTYVLCSETALELPQIKAFLDVLKSYKEDDYNVGNKSI
jgi:DNA-binding transcriptional LysR family regulator